MKAVLFRMVTDQHVCPFGIKSKHLLEKQGYTVEDRALGSRRETDEFKEKYEVESTPQTFIEGQRIGGYEELVEHFGVSTLKQEGVSYQPIIAVFATTFAMALAFVWQSVRPFELIALIEYFIATSMCVLAILKLRDLYSFTNQFITYDILAKRVLAYAYIYPFAEVLAGVGMIAGVWTPIVAATALFIGSVGAISVVKAVYIEKREIKCACVGGDSSVPLGAISLTENVMMVAMGLWMFLR